MAVEEEVVVAAVVAAAVGILGVAVEVQAAARGEGSHRLGRRRTTRQCEGGDLGLDPDLDRDHHGHQKEVGVLIIICHEVIVLYK